MIPLRDDIPSRKFPVVTLSLIAANVLVFFYELQLGPYLNGLLNDYALIPVRYAGGVAQYFSLSEKIFPFFTSMFLHGGWLHLIGNMWVLWIFGDNVEDRLGRLRFLGLYLAAGLAAGLVHTFTNAGSSVPTIGASGAVAGVMGAYFRFFPQARIATLIPPFFLGPYFELPALLFLGWWFLLQFFNGALSLALGVQGFAGVAWWAHVGGFAFGMAVSLFAPRRQRYYRSFHFDEI